MTPHVPAMAAFFFDQVTLPQSETRSESLVKILQALIPVAGGVYIAWMAFRWNRKNDHRRWILDNKKAEWQELLKFASAIEQFMPSVAIGSELTKTVHDPLFRGHLREMTQATLKCVFIPPAKAEEIYSSLLNVQLVNEQSKGHIEDYGSNAGLANALGKPRPLEAAKNVQAELIRLWREIRQFASDDLALEERNRWWRHFPIPVRRPPK